MVRIATLFMSLCVSLSIFAQTKAPTFFDATLDGNGKIQLDWSASTAPATGYRIYRNGIELTTINNLGTTQYVDINPIAGQILNYCITTLQGGTESAFKNCLADSSYLYNGLAASDLASDAFIDVSWSVDAQCLRPAIANGNDIYLEVRDLTNNKDVYTEILTELPEDTLARIALRVSGGDYLLLDQTYTGSNRTAGYLQQFGHAVAVDGNYAIIGAPKAKQDSGAAYVYENTAGGWARVAELRPTGLQANANLGYAVDIDGNYAIVSAPGGNGFAYVFERIGNNWVQRSTLQEDLLQTGDEFGYAVSISQNNAWVGAPKKFGPGVVYFYNRSGNNWNYSRRQFSRKPLQNQRFGSSIDYDNGYLVIGAPGDQSNTGAAYIYQEFGVYWIYRSRIQPNPSTSGDRYGTDVSIQGLTVAMGGPGVNGGEGEVVFYTKGNSSVWLIDGSISPNELNAGDNFGTSIQYLGNKLLASAPNRAADNGAGYVFVENNGTWTQEGKLTRTAGALADGFGQAVALGNDVAFIGAPYESTDQGKVYQYDFDGTEWVFNNSFSSLVSGSLTFEAWVKHNGALNTTGYTPLVSDQNVSFNLTAPGDGRVNFLAGSTPLFFNYQIPEDRWTHLAFVTDSIADNTRLYVNGELVDEVDFLCIFGVEQFGASTVNATNYHLNGELREIRYWSFARSATEIKDFYNSVLTSYPAGLEGYWKVNEGAGTVVAEVTGNYPQPAIYQPAGPATWVIDSISATVAGYIQQAVGPDKTINYELNTYEIGFGYNLCPTLTDVGTTLPYQAPIVYVDSSRPDSTKLYWTNQSDAISYYRVVRDGISQALIDSSVELWSDSYVFGDTNSLQNGQPYRYCLVPFSTRFKNQNGNSLVYDSICVRGNTLPIDLDATVIMATGEIDLQWNNMSQFGDWIEIYRDDQFFAQLDSNATQYTDASPVPGRTHNYQYRLYNDGNMVVATSDEATVQAIGYIAGRVIAESGDYALAGVDIELMSVIEGDTSILNTVSGIAGDFLFDQVYFGEASTFMLKATVPGDDYIIDSMQSVSLNLENPGVDDLIFHGSKLINPIGTLPLTLSNFTATDQAGMDAIALSWNYSSPDTTWFKLYRDGELLTILTDSNSIAVNSYLDNSSLPGANHAYEIQAYVYDTDTIVTEVSATDIVTQSPLAPVAVLNATQDLVAGVINLDWTHTSTEINGFYLFRDGLPIDTILVTDPYHFVDHYGIPGQSYTYSIQVFAERQGTMFTSTITNATPAPITYPGLQVPSNVVATAGIDVVAISWQYLVAANVNYYGFEIYRDNGSTVDTLGRYYKQFYQSLASGSLATYQFIDYTGVPGVNYTYGVSAIKLNPAYATPQGTDAETFPAVTMPNSFAATSGQIDHIDLGWMLNSNNIDGFILSRGGAAIDTLSRAQLMYSDAINTSPSSQTFNYSLRSYREVGGTWYPSNAVSASGQTSAHPNGLLQIPLSLVASDNYTNHVQLNWEYPNYVLSRFFVYRDGMLIDSLNNSLRFYYDTTVTPGETYIYTIEGRYKGVVSARASDVGGLGTLLQVEGMAQSDKGFGIPDVRVALSIGGEELYVTHTDATGFYRFEGVQNTTGVQIDVHAAGPNAHFLQPTKSVTTQLGVDRHVVNFLDTLFHNTIQNDGLVARPVPFIASIDKLTNQVELRWNVTSSNYSGFDITRGLSSAATVLAGSPLSFVDEFAAPGFNYYYSNQAFYYKATGTELSDTSLARIYVPKIAPVEAFQAIPDFDEDIVKLYWSHPTDKHTYYEIKRNGVVLGAVNTGETLYFVDTTGLPNRVYDYTITCYQVNSVGLFTSDPRMASTRFPFIAPITDLMLTAVPTDNRVDVSWRHTSRYYNYAVVYRDGVSIDTIPRSEGNKMSMDYWGIPGTTNRYAVSAVVIKEGMDYESDTVGSGILYPVVYPPDIQNTTPGFDQISLDALYIPVDGYTGFEFYRDNDPLEIRSGIATNVSFLDDDGTPEQSYWYKVRAFKTINNQYFSAFDSVQVTFPKLSTPTNVQASDGIYFNHIEVTWEFPSVANTGFIIFRDGVVLDTIGSVDVNSPNSSGSGARRYLDIVNNATGLPEFYDYSVQAYSIRGTTWYKSDISIDDDGYALIQRFSTVTDYAGTSGNEQLGFNVSLQGELAAAGTGTGVRRARTYALDATSTFGVKQVLTPDPQSGTNSAYGFDVDIVEGRLAVGAPWAWETNSSLSGYRSGEIYVYDVNRSYTAQLDTILRNINFVAERRGTAYRVTGTDSKTVVEDNSWCTVTAVNPVNTTTVGAANTSIGTVATGAPGWINGTDGLNFNANTDAFINSVVVYPEAAGNYIVQLWDGGILPIASQPFAANPSTPFEAQTVTLNFLVAEGNNYSLRLARPFTPILDTVEFRRNSNGASYNYTSTPITITGRRGAGGANAYNFFYNWSVSETDTVGTRCHELTTVYTESGQSVSFPVTFAETAYGTDLALDSITIDITKTSNGAAYVWLDNVRLQHVASGNTISLFSTSSNPAACNQENIDASFVAAGGGSITNVCGSPVTGVYTLTGNFSALNGQIPSGNYRLLYDVKLIDRDNAVANTLTADVTTASVGLYGTTLLGGIYAKFLTKEAEMGRSLAMNETSIAGGAPQFGSGVGEVTTFRKRNGSWDYQDTLFAAANLTPTSCDQFTLALNFPAYGDETSWNMVDANNNLVALGGPYGGFSNISINIPLAGFTPPFAFSIETVGFFNDNQVSYDISGGTGSVVSGFICCGQQNFRPNLRSCLAETFGYAVDMNNSQLVVGSRRFNAKDGFGPKGKVQYFKSGSANRWDQQQEIFIPNVGGGDDQFGFSVSLNENTLAVGAIGDDWDDNASVWDAGSVSLFDYDPGNDEFVFKRKLFNPDDPQKRFEYFGWSVALNGNLLAVGAPQVDSSSTVTSSGAVYLYEKNENETWVFKRRYFAPDGETDANFGRSVAVSGNTLMVGAPNHGGSNTGKVYFFYIRDQIDTVIASDGTEFNKTRIEWEYDGVRSNLSNFHIYRDGELIEAADPNKSFVFDYDGIPGKKYVYQVRPVSLDEVEGIPKGDIGWREPNGIVDGAVFTYQGQVGVPGVTITAWSTVEGERFEYSTVTDQEGKFKIKELYYGDSSRYFFKASLTGHEFLEDTLDIEYNLIQFERAIGPFYDLTAFVVTGIAKYENTDCPIDSVDVTQIAIRSDGNEARETKQTVADGSFAFNIEPYNTAIVRYEYEIANQRYRVSDSALMDTLYYNWAFTNQQLSNLSSVSKVTQLQDFVDTTTYPVQIFIQSVCGPIGQNRWSVQIKSKDGCYDNVVKTDFNGRIRVPLAPKSYVFRVIDVDQPTPQTIPVIEYLKVRPRSLNLTAFHESLDGAATDTVLPMDFVFHVSPEISLVNLDNFLCDDPLLPVVVSQGDTKTIEVAVGETFDGTTCATNEGFLIIRNNASTDDAVRIDYDPDLGGFPAYSFIVGPPNIVAPYVQFMFVEYHTEADGFLGQYGQAFLIEGVAAVPGNDIIVTPGTDQDNQVLLPLMILRDPPGDGSYAQIDSGTSFESTLSIADDYNFGLGLGIQSKFKAFGVGLQLDIDASITGGFSRGTTFKVTSSTSKTISTSSDSEADNADQSSKFVGDKADVVVGAGLALQYGIGVQVFVNDTCGVIVRDIITTGAEVKTTWIYAVDQIRHLVNEYERNITRTENGEYIIDGFTEDETKSFLAIRKDNWNQVLYYHGVKTLPHYALCDPSNFAEIPEPWKSAAKEWRTQGFCNLIGTYSTDGKTFNMNDEIVWDANLIERYNKVSQQVDDIEDYLNYAGKVIYIESLLDDVELDQAYLSQYGPDAKNITFSGGTSYSESRNISREKGTSFTQKVGGGASFALQAIASGKVVLYTGVWAGFGAGAWGGSSIDLTDFSTSFTPKFNFNISYNETKASATSLSQAVSYTLADDDPGDQYSVTIIRGAQANHTPYFSLLGGRTSCPTEPGAISRDMPGIELIDAQGNGYSNVQQNLTPGTTARFPVQLNSLNPFGEGRWYQAYIVENSNVNGASIKINGKTLSTNATEDFFIPARGSVYADLSVDKGPFYNNAKFTLGLRSLCDVYVIATQDLEVYWRTPCTDVSIVEPSDGWVINSDTAKMTIKLKDYNPYNPLLKRIELVYRRLGDQTYKYDTLGSLSRAELIDYYERFKPTYPLPTYPFVWDISSLNLPDGDYEIMAIANCATGGLVESNKVKGTIARNLFTLFGVPEPADGLLSLGDEVSVAFNKQIDCPLAYSEAQYTFHAGSATGPMINATMACFGNKLIFQLDSLHLFEGQMVYATLYNVKDVNGNLQEDTVRWSFEISNNPIYWSPRDIEVTVEKGKTMTFTAMLRNTGAGNEAYTLSNALTWLQPGNVSGIVLPSGTPVTFTVDATDQQVGVYSDVAEADITGFTVEELPITIRVIKPVPDWTVDPSAYEHSVNVIANVSIDNGPLSTDESDVITAWIDGELRGVGKVEAEGAYYAAYLTVHGDAIDTTKLIDFRVWDASAGAQYQGHVDPSFGNITFESDNTIYGTTPSPVIINVDTDVDSLQYIPLRAGWNWLSFNTVQRDATGEIDMTVNNVLKSLSPAQNDMMMDYQGNSWDYDLGTWVTTSGQDTVNNESGYLLFLDEADTLRIAGEEAPNAAIFLPEGWNLIGYQIPFAQPLNPASFAVISTTTFDDGDIFKGEDAFSVWSDADTAWQGNLEFLEPWKAYKVKSGSPRVINYARSNGPATWNVSETNYEHAMRVLAVLRVDGFEFRDNVSMVSAFVGNECRGVAELQYMPHLNRYIAPLFVYSNNPGEEVSFYFWDGLADTVYTAAQKVAFNPDAIVGHLRQPKVLSPDDISTGIDGDHEPMQVGFALTPNPFQGQLLLTFEEPAPADYDVVMHNAIGEQVMARSLQSVKGANRIYLNADRNLANGVYFVTVRTVDGPVASFKVVKQ